MPNSKAQNRIDEVIHQRARLAIMATLAGVDSLGFNQLKAELGLTDGNLSSHATALERAGYAKIHKGYKGRRPRTTIAITAAGRKALARYVSSLQRILNKARSEPAK